MIIIMDSGLQISSHVSTTNNFKAFPFIKTKTNFQKQRKNHYLQCFKILFKLKNNKNKKKNKKNTSSKQKENNAQKK